MDRAVGLELINEPGKALALYHELSTRLSRALHGIAQRREGEGERERRVRERERRVRERGRRVRERGREGGG